MLLEPLVLCAPSSHSLPLSPLPLSYPSSLCHIPEHWEDTCCLPNSSDLVSDHLLSLQYSGGSVYAYQCITDCLHDYCISHWNRLPSQCSTKLVTLLSHLLPHTCSPFLHSPTHTPTHSLPSLNPPTLPHTHSLPSQHTSKLPHTLKTHLHSPILTHYPPNTLLNSPTHSLLSLNPPTLPHTLTSIPKPTYTPPYSLTTLPTHF